MGCWWRRFSISRIVAGSTTGGALRQDDMGPGVV